MANNNPFTMRSAQMIDTKYTANYRITLFILSITNEVVDSGLV